MKPTTAIVLFAHANTDNSKPLGLRSRFLPRVMLRNSVRLLAGLELDQPIFVVTDQPVGQDITTILRSHNATFLTQTGETFGERVGAALKQVESLGYKKFVLIGSDTPELQLNDIQVALNDEGTIGPSNDGGFYLLSFCDSQIDQLSKIRWGTRHAKSDAVAHLSPKRFLKCRQDVDHFGDVELVEGAELEVSAQLHIAYRFPCIPFEHPSLPSRGPPL